MADATDLKSVVRKDVRVRAPPQVPFTLYPQKVKKNAHVFTNITKMLIFYDVFQLIHLQ